MRSFSESYRAAGVDITAGYEGVRLMKKHVQRTMIPGVVSDLGLTHAEIAHDLMREIELSLDELEQLDADELVARRYDKFRAMGGDRTCSL